MFIEKGFWSFVSQLTLHHLNNKHVMKCQPSILFSQSTFEWVVPEAVSGRKFLLCLNSLKYLEKQRRLD